MKISRNIRKTLGMRVGAAFVLSLMVLHTTSLGVQTASAVGSSCSTITDCTMQINNANNQVSSLKSQATSYKDAIGRLSNDISTKRNEISYNQNEQTRLENEIAKAQADIDKQKFVLGEDIRTMYIDGQMTTIEALATSDSLSEYVDKQEYRTSVQNSLHTTLEEIAKLQAKLRTQKDQVSSLLSQQRTQAASLQAAQSEQSNLLGMNQSQQASYNAQTAANQSRLAALIAAQRSVNQSSKGGYYFLRFGGGIGKFNPGNYPYRNAGFSMSTAPGCNDNDGPDKWGYCTRQCVSYAAWAVEASGRTAPQYYGNAKNWVAKAKAKGVLVSNVPMPGDVAISTSGTWGHAMYVEQVSGNKIYVSQYNQSLNGEFSYQWRQWQ